jgi:hypothetical protein
LLILAVSLEQVKRGVLWRRSLSLLTGEDQENWILQREQQQREYEKLRDQFYSHDSPSASYDPNKAFDCEVCSSFLSLLTPPLLLFIYSLSLLAAIPCLAFSSELRAWIVR